MDRLSYFILQSIENAVSANASLVGISVVKAASSDSYDISVDDNRSEFVLVDAACPADDGRRAGRSRYGGRHVTAQVELDGRNGCALENLAAALSSVICTQPDVDVRCRLVCGSWQQTILMSDIVRKLPLGERAGLAVARVAFHHIDDMVSRFRCEAGAHGESAK